MRLLIVLIVLYMVDAKSIDLASAHVVIMPNSPQRAKIYAEMLSAEVTLYNLTLQHT
jgi:purine-nucleoside phosphorylase